jgi:hypothetical protein
MTVQIDLRTVNNTLLAKATQGTFGLSAQVIVEWLSLAFSILWAYVQSISKGKPGE